MSQKVTIRPAKPLDVSNLCRLLLQAIGEGFYPEPDEIMGINWVTQILSEGYVVVAEKSGRIIGSIAVTNYRFPWSPKWYIYVDWMFVSKSFRSGGVFEALVKPIHDYADRKKAPIYGGIMSGRDSKLKDRLMQMHGYHYLGGQFIRDLSIGEIDDGQRLKKENDQDAVDVHATELD